MTVKTSAENLAKSKELDRKVKFKTIPIQEFLLIQPADNNRHSRRRAKISR